MYLSAVLKICVLCIAALPMSLVAQLTDFRMLARADSTMIISILKGIEETDQISLHTMRTYKPSNGYQRVFVWWRVDGVKEDWTRGVFTLDRTVDGVVGYSIDANSKHPKHHLLNNSEYISKILNGL